MIYLWIKVNRHKCKPILLCCTYKSPRVDTTQLIDCLTESFSLVNQDKYDIILLGDLNEVFLGNGLKHASSRLLRNFAISSNLTQAIKAPTRITSTSRTMIGRIFVNNQHHIIHSGVIPMSISDHFLVYCMLKTDVRKVLPKVIELLL